MINLGNIVVKKICVMILFGHNMFITGKDQPWQYRFKED